MRITCFVPLVAAALVVASAAQAEVLIRVDKSAQIMTVDVDGAQRYAWPVSTGLAQYDTPTGAFKPFRMEKDHFSREWDDAPMPHSIFFTTEGHAIHGSGHVKNLGRPASHGCVRLAPANAATLFALVRKEKMANTRVVLTGEVPRTNELVAKRNDTGRNDNGRGDNGRDSNAIMQDEGFTGALPGQRKLRVTRDGWREIPNQREFFYTERRYDAPRRYYRTGGFPFGW